MAAFAQEGGRLVLKQQCPLLACPRASRDTEGMIPSAHLAFAMAVLRCCAGWRLARTTAAAWCRHGNWALLLLRQPTGPASRIFSKRAPAGKRRVSNLHLCRADAPCRHETAA